MNVVLGDEMFFLYRMFNFLIFIDLIFCKIDEQGNKILL